MSKTSNTEVNALNLSGNAYMNSTTKFVKGAVGNSLTPTHSKNNVQVPNFNSTNNLINRPSPNKDFTPSSIITQKTPVKPVESSPKKPSLNKPTAELEVTKVIEPTPEAKAMHMAGNIFMNSTTKFMKGLTNLINGGKGQHSSSKQKNISPINKKAEDSPSPGKKTAVSKKEESPVKGNKTPEKTAYELAGNNYMNSTTKYSKPAVGFSDLSIDNSKLLKFDTGSKKIIPTRQVASPAKSSISIQSKVQIDKFHDFNGRGKNVKAEISTVDQTQNDKGDQANNDTEAKRIERRKEGGRRELKFTEKKDQKQVIAQTTVITDRTINQRVVSPTKNQSNSRDQVSPARSVQTRITLIQPKGVINKNNMARDKVPEAKIVDGRIATAKSADSKFVEETVKTVVNPFSRQPQPARKSIINNQTSQKETIQKNVKPSVLIQQKSPSKPLSIAKIQQKSVTPSKPVSNSKIIEKSTTPSKLISNNKLQQKSVSPSKPLIAKKQTPKPSVITKQQIQTVPIKPIQRNSKIQKSPNATAVKEEQKEEPKLITSPRKQVNKESQIKQNNSKISVQNNATKNNTTNQINFQRLWGNQTSKVVRQLEKNQKIIQQKSPIKQVSKPETKTGPKSNPTIPSEEVKPTSNYQTRRTSKLETPRESKLIVQEEQIDSKKKILNKNQEVQPQKKELPQTNIYQRNSIQSPSNNQSQIAQNNIQRQVVSPQSIQQPTAQNNSQRQVVSPQTIQQSTTINPYQRNNNNISQNNAVNTQQNQQNTPYNPYQRKNANISNNQNDINNSSTQVTPSLPFQRTNVVSPQSNQNKIQPNVQSIITQVVSPPKIQEAVSPKKQNQQSAVIKGQTSKPSSKNQIKSQGIIQAVTEIVYNGKKPIPIFQVLQKYYQSKINIGFKSIKTVSAQSNYHKKQLNILVFSVEDIYTSLYASNARLVFEQLKKSWVNGTLVKKPSVVRQNAKQNAALSILMRIASQKIRQHFQTIKQRSWINKQLGVLQIATNNGNKIENVDKLNERSYHLTQISKIIQNYHINILQREAFKKLTFEALSNLNKKKVLAPIVPVIGASKSPYKSNKPPRDYEAEKQVLNFNKNEVQSDISTIQRRIGDKKRYHDNQKAKLIKKFDQNHRKNKTMETEVEIKRRRQRQLKLVVDQLPVSGELDISLPEGEPLVGLLTEIYAQIFRNQTETINSQALVKKYALVKEDHNPLLQQWVALNLNITLKTQIAKWQGVEVREHRARETMSSEQTLITKLLSNYVRQRYLWEWVRMTAQKI